MREGGEEQKEERSERLSRPSRVLRGAVVPPTKYVRAFVRFVNAT